MKVSGNKKIIMKGKPEWKPVQRVNEKFQKAVKLYKGHAENYKSLAEKNMKLLKSYRFSKVNTSKIRSKIGKYNRSIKRSIYLRRKKIKTAYSKLDEAKRKGHDSAIIVEKKSLLDEMEKKLNKIELLNVDLNSKVKQFNREAGAKRVFWVGPGMSTHTIITDIQKLGKRVNVLGKEFSKLVGRFKSKK